MYSNVSHNPNFFFFFLHFNFSTAAGSPILKSLKKNLAVTEFSLMSQQFMQD